MVGLPMRVGEEVEEERLRKTELIFGTETTIRNIKREEEDIGAKVEVEAIEAVGEVEGASIRTLVPKKHLPTSWPIFLPCLPHRRALTQERLNHLIRL